MKFSKFYLITELFANWEYFVPWDKKFRLFDFYAITYIRPNELSDINMKLAFNEAQEKILNALIEDFKFALMFSLASEFRHVGGIRPMIDMQDVDQQKALKLFFKSIGEEKFIKDFEKKVRGDWGREASYNAIKKLKISPLRMASIFEKTFTSTLFTHLLGPQYGGEKWAEIARSWGKLYTVKNPGDKMVLIDHIYDLQHNNDTVFNKVVEYAKDGRYGWLKDALDFKRDIKNPLEMYDEVSPGLKDPFVYAVKLATGMTLQKTREDTGEDLKLIKNMWVKIKKLNKGEVFGHGKERVEINDEHIKDLSGKIVKIYYVYETLKNIFDVLPRGKKSGFTTIHRAMVEKVVPSKDVKMSAKEIKQTMINFLKSGKHMHAVDFYMIHTGKPFIAAMKLKNKLYDKMPKKTREQDRIEAIMLMKNKKLKEGDKVQLRKNLVIGRKYGQLQIEYEKDFDKILKRNDYIVTVGAPPAKDGRSFLTDYISAGGVGGKFVITVEMVSKIYSKNSKDRDEADILTKLIKDFEKLG